MTLCRGWAMMGSLAVGALDDAGRLGRAGAGLCASLWCCGT